VDEGEKQRGGGFQKLNQWKEKLVKKEEITRGKTGGSRKNKNNGEKPCKGIRALGTKPEQWNEGERQQHNLSEKAREKKTKLWGKKKKHHQKQGPIPGGN